MPGMPIAFDEPSEWKDAQSPCHNRVGIAGSQWCEGKVQYRVHESSDGAYEDCQYRCTKCGRSWWVDGPDS